MPDCNDFCFRGSPSSLVFPVLSVPRSKSAFGQSEGAPADRFLVGLATLTLLAGAASANGPLTCLIDDAQWLDRESLEVLSFVGRRLYAEGIVLLFGLRDPVDHPFPLDGLPKMHLVGLVDKAARELLRASAPGPLDSRTVTRIVAETEGNPLAIVELVGELSTEELAVGGLLPEILSVHSRLESHFLRQLRELPAGAQTLLLIASAESTGDRDLIWRVACQLGVLREDAVAVEAHGLLELRPHVSFRHPLLRSAVYGAASAAECRKVHAALAEATDSGTDPERKAWHLGLATYLPDESVAAELERSAERQRRSGGSAVVSKFLMLAADLTPKSEDQARRRLRAAEAALTAGAPGQSRALLDETTPHLQDPLLRAQALRLDGALRAFTVPGEIPMILLTAARALRPLDAQLAARQPVGGVDGNARVRPTHPVDQSTRDRPGGSGGTTWDRPRAIHWRPHARRSWDAYRHRICGRRPDPSTCNRDTEC